MYFVKKMTGMFFTIHFPVNGPSGYMKKFSRNFFHASPVGVNRRDGMNKTLLERIFTSAQRGKYMDVFDNPSLTFHAFPANKPFQSNTKSVTIHHPRGEVSEWLKELAWKAGIR